MPSSGADAMIDGRDSHVASPDSTLQHSPSQHKVVQSDSKSTHERFHHIKASKEEHSECCEALSVNCAIGLNQIKSNQSRAEQIELCPSDPIDVRSLDCIELNQNQHWISIGSNHWVAMGDEDEDGSLTSLGMCRYCRNGIGSASSHCIGLDWSIANIICQ